MESAGNVEGFMEDLWRNDSLSFSFDEGHSQLDGNVTETRGFIIVKSIAVTLYSLIMILGLCGNSLVIYVVLRYSKMQTVTNLYILNLALADECFLVGLPFVIITSFSPWPFGTTMCRVYMTMTGINQFTSSIILTVMSADRYIAVCHPISAPRLRTPLISRIVSLTAWTASALLIVPIFMYSGVLGKEDRRSCNVIFPDSDSMRGETCFIFYSFALSFAIPVILIFIFYSLVIRKLRTVGPKNRSQEKRKSHRKVTKLVLTVIAVYVFCWLPYWTTQLSLLLTPYRSPMSHEAVTVFLLASCLAYSNSAINPILYAFLSENFKKSFSRACRCHLRRGGFQEQTQTSRRLAGPTTINGPVTNNRDANDDAKTLVVAETQQ